MTPIPKVRWGKAPAPSPKNFWTYLRAHAYIKLDKRKFYTGQTTPPALARIFKPRMLTLDLFAVANLFV